MTVAEVLEHLHRRISRLKDKYGVSYRAMAREAGMAQSHLFQFVWRRKSNLTVETLSRLDEAVRRLEQEREAR